MNANKLIPKMHHTASDLILRWHSLLQTVLMERFASSEAEAFEYLTKGNFDYIYGLYEQPDKRVLSLGTVSEEGFPNNFARLEKEDLNFVNPDAFADGETGFYFYLLDYVVVPTKIAEFSSSLEVESLCASICESSPLCTAGFQLDEVETPSFGLTYGCVSSCCYVTEILPFLDKTHLTCASSYLNERHFSIRRNVLLS